MTKRECAIVMAYTGTCMLAGKDLYEFYDYIVGIMGEPIWSHEIYTRADEIKEKARPDFIRLCREASE